jgi:hypothetical protein
MKTLPLLSTFLLLLCSCVRENPQPVEQLPALTQEGAHTFGCLINGEAWVPKSFLLGVLGNPYSPRLKASFDPVSHRLFLESNRIIEKELIEQSFLIYSDSLAVGDTTWLGQEETSYPPFYHEHFAYFFDEHLPASYATWSTDSLTFSGYIHCTDVRVTSGDGLPSFVAGTFAFTARNKDSTQYLDVTEGRFDIRLDQ